MDLAIVYFSQSVVGDFCLEHLLFGQLKFIDSISCNNTKSHGVWQICPLAKLDRSHLPISISRAKACFELSDVDNWGPYPCKTHDGASFFLTIIDDYTRATSVHLIAHKSNTFPLLKAFIAFVEKQFGATVKVIRSDNGREFKEISKLEFYGQKDILHQTSCVDTPQQNGVVERKHQHLL